MVKSKNKKRSQDWGKRLSKKMHRFCERTKFVVNDGVVHKKWTFSRFKKHYRFKKTNEKSNDLKPFKRTWKNDRSRTMNERNEKKNAPSCKNESWERNKQNNQFKLKLCTAEKFAFLWLKNSEIEFILENWIKCKGRCFSCPTSNLIFFFLLKKHFFFSKMLIYIRN